MYSSSIQPQNETPVPNVLWWVTARISCKAESGTFLMSHDHCRCVCVCAPGCWGWTKWVWLHMYDLRLASILWSIKSGFHNLEGLFLSQPSLTSGYNMQTCETIPWHCYVTETQQGLRLCLDVDQKLNQPDKRQMKSAIDKWLNGFFFFVVFLEVFTS